MALLPVETTNSSPGNMKATVSLFPSPILTIVKIDETAQSSYLLPIILASRCFNDMTHINSYT